MHSNIMFTFYRPFPVFIWSVAVFLGILVFSDRSLCRAEHTKEGLVVEAVQKDSGADQAGIRVGDILLEWTRLPNPPANPEKKEGVFRFFFDLAKAEIEEAPRGPLRIFGERDGKPFQADMPWHEWDLAVRPMLTPEIAALYHKGKDLLADTEFDDALDQWKKVAAIALKQKDRLTAAWLLCLSGKILADAGRESESQSAYDQALDQISQVHHPAFTAQVWGMKGLTYRRQKEYQRMEECWQQALEVWTDPSTQNLGRAQAFSRLGLAAFFLADYAKSEEYYQKALEIKEKLVPGSLCLAWSLQDCANLAWRQGRLGDARRIFQNALAIQEKMAPENLETAASLMRLGVLAAQTGNLAEAGKLFQRNLKIKQKLNPKSLGTARSLNNMGSLAYTRGDYIQSELYFNQALKIKQNLQPDSVTVAYTLENLGNVAVKRGNLAKAEDIYRQALKLYEKHPSKHTQTQIGDMLTHLGFVALSRDQLEEAKQYFHRALVICEKQFPGGLGVAANLRNLGETSYKKGNYARAGEYFQQSLDIAGKIAPGSLATALGLSRLGLTALHLKEYSEAEARLKHALTILEQLCPETANEAEVLRRLASLYQKQNRFPEALEYLTRAVEDLEAQRGKLGGGSEAMESFSAKYADYYRDLVDLQMRLKKTGEAFHTLEKFRAAVLRHMLAERDLEFTLDAPRRLILEQRRVNCEYDRTQNQLAKLKPEQDADKLTAYQKKMSKLREEQARIREQIRNASPRLAALQSPYPLDLKHATDMLPAGTLFLSYCVGPQSTLLFALFDGELHVYPISMDRVTLTRNINYFRELLSRPDSRFSRISSLARQLYDALILPAEKRIEDSRRIIVCPDGPLHLLPFSTLMNKNNHYLVETRPVSRVISATIYAEVRAKKAVVDNPVDLVAFGDPAYPARQKPDGDNPLFRSIMQTNDLSPLPSSRNEVEAICRLYPKTSRKYLGEAAQEEVAKSLGKEPRFIHFACHGILNERFPLDSGLVLTVPEKYAQGRDNGILQAWEIFETLRIDADLVTLSACKTGLGAEMGGEGLIGLTRAFLYAGAHSVLSSLWSVADDTTSELMERFYGHLKQGKSKNDALRLAKLDFIHGKAGNGGRKKDEGFADASLHAHPFYWAAFVLNGDWD